MKIITILAAFFFVASFAQAQKKMMLIQGEGAMMINEIGVIVTMKSGIITVENIAPSAVRPKDAQSVDLQKDDAILMANGKKIATTKELKELYEQSKIGSEIKLGAKRGENLFIVVFKKEETKDMPEQKKMVMHINRKDGEEILPAVGLIVSEKNNEVHVKSILPNSESNFKNFTPEEGDVIISINGTSVNKTSALIGVYDKIETGTTVKLVFSRKGKETAVNFPKPQQRIFLNK